MARRSPQSDGFDPRALDDAINASISGFNRLNRRGQIVVIVILVCAAIVAAIVYLHYQQPAIQTASTHVSSVHLLLGNPSIANSSDHDNYLMIKPYYVLSYNSHRGEPNWVSWQVTSADLGDAPRKQIFDPDDQLPIGFNIVKTTDYSGSGFDRGHLCPHSDRAANIDMSYSTFVMSNIIPQAPNVNQKAWNQFENYCRDLVKDHNHLYIISGPLGEGGTGSKGFKSTIGKSVSVTVPAECWKVVVVVPESGSDNDDTGKISSSTRVIAIDVPNDNTSVGDPWDIYRTTPAAIEAKTGYHFFDQLNPDVAAALRQKLDDTRIAPPRPLTHERGTRLIAMENPPAIERLKAAVQDLTYPSESDEPFDVIRWDNSKTLALAIVLESKVGKGRKIKSISVDEFFQPLKQTDDAARYNQLRAALELSAAPLQVFRVGEGEVRVDIYLISPEKGASTIIGVHTASVET